MSEQRAEYQVAYTTPSIEKIATDFQLPALDMNRRWREALNNQRLGIYFIQSAEGYIKIGKSNDIVKRLGSYRTHHPMTRLVGMIGCASKYLDYNENLLHRLWEPFIVSLEWFAPVRPLIEYIQSFDDIGCGHPMELFNTEPATWKELRDIQRAFAEMDRSWRQR
jgi:hypothetical protein